MEETNSTILNEKCSQLVFFFHLYIQKRDGFKRFISNTALLHPLVRCVGCFLVWGLHKDISFHLGRTPIMGTDKAVTKTEG